MMDGFPLVSFEEWGLTSFSSLLSYGDSDDSLSLSLSFPSLIFFVDIDKIILRELKSVSFLKIYDTI